MKRKTITTNCRKELRIPWKAQDDALCPGEDALVCWYDPAKCTVGFLQQIIDIHDARQILDFYCLLFSLLDEWDLEDEEGQQLPVNRAIISDLPIDFCKAIANVIIEELSYQNLIMRLPKTKGE